MRRGEQFHARISAKIFRRITEKPEIQVQIFKLDESCGVLWENKCRNHVAPRPKLSVLNGDFPVLLNCVDVQGQAKRSLDALQEATVDDYWNMDGEKFA